MPRDDEFVDGLSAQEVLVHDPVEYGRVAGAVPDPLGVNDSDRPSLADPQAADASPQNASLLREPSFPEPVLEVLPRREGTLSVRTLRVFPVGAEENVPAGDGDADFSDFPLDPFSHAGGVLLHGTVPHCSSVGEQGPAASLSRYRLVPDPSPTAQESRSETMGLLKDFLRIEADRRGAHSALRLEAQSQRLQIEEIGAEARRKRDEMAMIEEGLRRLAQDIARSEEQLLEIESRRDGHDHEAHDRKVDAVRSSLEYDRADGHRISDDFRRLRSAFEGERMRLLAEADSGRMMDNFFQIEAFLKDTGTPIPDAARKALMKERQDLQARIGPLVAPPPAPDGVFKATLVYSALEEGEPTAVVAFGLPDEAEPSGAHDLAALLLYGSYASVVEKIGPGVPRPRREEGAVIYEQPAGSRAADEAALDLFLAVKCGLEKAAAAAGVPCELTGIFLEPEIASAVFPRGGLTRRF